MNAEEDDQHRQHFQEDHSHGTVQVVPRNYAKSSYILFICCCYYRSSLPGLNPPPFFYRIWHTTLTFDDSLQVEKETGGGFLYQSSWQLTENISLRYAIRLDAFMPLFRIPPPSLFDNDKMHFVAKISILYCMYNISVQYWNLSCLILCSKICIDWVNIFLLKV